MTRSPKTVGPDVFAIAALDIMEQKKITSLPVVDDSRPACWACCICMICGARRCCKTEMLLGR